MAFPDARRAALACVLVFAAVSAAPSAHAGEDSPGADSAAEARSQYQMGTKAFSAKRYSEAALHFEAAASFKASAIALYTAALAWDLASRPERAADAYARALDVPGLDEKQTNTAKDRVAALERSLGTVQVVAPDGTKVQLDTFTEVNAPAKLHGSPGVHSLTIHPTGKPIQRRDVTLEAGKTVSIDLKEEPKPKPEPKVEEPPKNEPPPSTTELPPRLAHPFWTTPKVVGVGVAGLGLAALAGGVILGLNAQDAGDAYASAPTRAAFDHASSLQTWTNVTLVTGVILVTGGIALVAIPIGGDKGERSMHAGVTPGGMSLGGTF